MDSGFIHASKTANVHPDELIQEFMTDYSRNVYLLAYSYVKDEGLAEDISQEVFMKCYKNIHKFKGISSPKSWVLKITVNTAKDFIKMKSFKSLKYSLDKFENLLKRRSAEQEFMENQVKDQIVENVLSLSPKYREIIILYYFQELKVEEIKVILGLNENTIKTRLSRGRKLLKDILREDEPHV